MYFAFQRLTKVAIIFDYSISGAVPCLGGTSVRGIAPDGHFKQASGAAPCPGGPSVRGSCTGWGRKTDRPPPGREKRAEMQPKENKKMKMKEN